MDKVAGCRRSFCCAAPAPRKENSNALFAGIGIDEIMRRRNIVRVDFIHMYSFSTLIQIIEILGMLAFAISGFVEARRKDMDLVGVFTVAFITAFGGGTLRDLLLDRRPLFWVEHHEYSLLVFALVFVLTPLLRYLRFTFSEKMLVTADALGLGVFSVLGASLALRADMPLFVSVMMGVITGIFGGVLRDVICNEIPMVFRRGQLYATCAFIGCWCYLLLNLLKVPEVVSLSAGISLTVLIRLAAVRFDLRLPA